MMYMVKPKPRIFNGNRANMMPPFTSTIIWKILYNQNAFILLKANERHKNIANCNYLLVNLGMHFDCVLKFFSCIFPHFRTFLYVFLFSNLLAVKVQCFNHQIELITSSNDVITKASKMTCYQNRTQRINDAHVELKEPIQKPSEYGLCIKW